MIRISVFILLTLLFNIISTQTPPTTNLNLPSQCYSYSIIQDESRNVNAAGSNGCDTMFLSNPTWIRFVGLSATELSTSPTSPNQCGTQVTGWYSDIMPTVAQTIANGRVCFSWGTNNCQWSNTISVTNCGSFYVYRLTVPPVCSARYCTTTYNPTTTTTTSASSLPQCIDYTTINDSSRNIEQFNGGLSDTDYFRTNVSWYRFIGSGGTQIPTTPTPANRCGAIGGGWYAGDMPTSPHETINGTVCYTWLTRNCAFKSDIQVTNCGSYYVYYLSAPPNRSLRYCTETESEQTQIPSNKMSSYQCYNHTAINEPTRNVNKEGTASTDKTYFSSGAQWIRFRGSGGTQIPTTPVEIHKCDTYAPGWYSGEMPTIPDTTKNGTVCFTYTSGNCSFQHNIQVTNCGSYYVYYLSSPTTTGTRYCTTDSTITSVL